MKSSNNKHLPLMVYMPQDLIAHTKSFADATNQSVSQVVRNSILAFTDNKTNDNNITKNWNDGFDEGLNTALKIIISDKCVKSFVDKKSGLTVFDRIANEIEHEIRRK